MNRQQRRAAQAQSRSKSTPDAADKERMWLMQRNEDGIRRSHEAACAALGDDVVVVVADPRDPLGRVVSTNEEMSDAQMDTLIASEARNGRRPTIISTMRREDVLRGVEKSAPLVARNLRAWSPDTGRILVMCVAAGGIKVAELGLSSGADADRFRAEILQQSEYGIRRAREEQVQRAGKADVVVVVADTRDPTGRAVALSSGETDATIDAMIASAASKGGLPILIVGMPRDAVIRSVQRNLPRVAAILKDWSPESGEFPAVCFAAGAETVAMLADVELGPVGSA